MRHDHDGGEFIELFSRCEFGIWDLFFFWSVMEFCGKKYK